MITISYERCESESSKAVEKIVAMLKAAGKGEHEARLVANFAVRLAYKPQDAVDVFAAKYSR